MKPPDKDFVSALRREDAEQRAEGMPAGLELKIRKQLRAPPPKRHVPWVFAFAAAAAVAALVFFFSTPSPRIIGPLVVRADGTSLTSTADEISCASCALEDPLRGVTFVARGAVQLRADTEGMRLMRGEVEVSVEKVRPGAAAVRVPVSHGIIEVRGTRFTVTQTEDGGEVVLHEGSIAFLALDGRVQVLGPGDRLKWPWPQSQPPPEEVAPVPPEPAPVDPPPSTPPPPPRKPRTPEVAAPEPATRSADEILGRLSELRSNGDFALAATELERALGEPLAPTTRERLSFELGTIVANHLHEKPRACSHWIRHQAQFPGGRYARQIAEIQGRLRCPN